MLKVINCYIALSNNFTFQNTKMLNLLFKKQQQKLHTLRFQSTVLIENEDNSEFSAKIEWKNAKRFEEIPTVSYFKLLKGIIPGGKYTNFDSAQVLLAFKNSFGNIVRLPPILGRKEIIITYNVEDFARLLRNEGIWPNRPGAEALQYYRQVHRAEFFQGSEGLVSPQGESWSTFRSAVNPVMLQPKNVRLYLQKMSNVSEEFIERIRQIRDPKTLEVPETFKEEINRWALDSVSVVALDKQLGLITKNRDDSKAKELFQALSEYFLYVFDIEFKTPFWKYYKTPAFKKLMKSLDKITNATGLYVNEAIERLERERKNGLPVKSEHEESVLQKLIKIDQKIATVLAMDMLMVGVDTTTCIFTGILLCMAKNPDKQEILRQEVLKVLPEKDSEFDEDVMKNMPYLRACIKESQRIYPLTVGNAARVPFEDVVVSGYRVPKGTQVCMCSVSLLRDSAYFPRPNEFLPERWLTPNTDKEIDAADGLKPSSPFVHLPFGFGPRSRIGRRISEIELELGLARIVRNYQIEFNYSTEKAFKSLLINFPNIPLKFKFIDVDY